MKLSNIINKAIEIAREFPETIAVGLSGSQSTAQNDEYSDYDICIYAKTIPKAKKRQEIYKRHTLADTRFFDVDFEVSRGDGLDIENELLDFLWMDINVVKTFISNLTIDYYCDEFLPGGLIKMSPLFDPTDTIGELRRMIPQYPHERAIRRIEQNIRRAYLHIHTLAWFDKAILRNDHYSFLKYTFEVIDAFCTAIFALNNEWFSDEKRLFSRIDKMALSPSNVSERMESIILHTGKHANLRNCLENINKLFEELVVLSCKKYETLDVPRKWD